MRKTANLVMRVPEDLKAMLRQHSDRTGVTQTELVSELLRSYFGLNKCVALHDHERIAVLKKNAYAAVRKALDQGVITRPDECEACGCTADTEAHHHKGYEPEHALDVLWLCHHCHHRAHGRLIGEAGQPRAPRHRQQGWQNDLRERMESLPDDTVGGDLAQRLSAANDEFNDVLRATASDL